MSKGLWPTAWAYFTNSNTSQAVSGEDTPSHPPLQHEGNGTNINFARAANGWVLTMRQPYNNTTNFSPDPVVYIVPEGQSLIDQIAVMLVEGKLT